MGDLGRCVSIGIWVSKLVARMLATAALWVRIQTSLKNVRHTQRSGQHTLGTPVARQKNMQKINFFGTRIGPPFNEVQYAICSLERFLLIIFSFYSGFIWPFNEALQSGLTR
jgi:hypothetical protein